MSPLLEPPTMFLRQMEPSPASFHRWPVAHCQCNRPETRSTAPTHSGHRLTEITRHAAPALYARCRHPTCPGRARHQAADRPGGRARSLAAGEREAPCAQRPWCWVGRGRSTRQSTLRGCCQGELRPQPDGESRPGRGRQTNQNFKALDGVVRGPRVVSLICHSLLFRPASLQAVGLPWRGWPRAR